VSVLAARPDTPFGDPEQRRHSEGQRTCDPVGHAKNTVRLCRVTDPLDLGFGHRVGLQAFSPAKPFLAFLFRVEPQFALSLSVSGKPLSIEQGSIIRALGAFSSASKHACRLVSLSLIEAKVILHQLLAMLRREPDLEDAWPEFSRNKQALSDRVVSDAVQHGFGFQTIDGA